MRVILQQLKQLQNTVRRWAIGLISAAGVFVFASPVMAQVRTSGVAEGIALSDRDPIEVVLYILSWVLGIAGLLLLVYILYGGFLWMTSRGEEEQIAKAKRTLQQGLIGLLIIMSAWGIVLWLLRILSGATGTELGGNGAGNCVGCSVPSGGSSFYVMSTNPQANETDVFLCSDITVRMSEDVDTGTVTSDNWYLQVEGGAPNGASCSANNSCASATCQDSACVGDTIPGVIGFGPGDSTSYFNFIPDQDLPEGTTFMATVEGNADGVLSADGVSMSTTYTWTFTTGTETDEIPPQVEENGSSPFPTDGETNVCLNTVINFDFNEAMRVSSFNDDTAMVLDTAADGGPDWEDPLGLRGWSFGGNFDYASARPSTQLNSFSEYSTRLYGGDASNDFAGAPTDSCGNPLDGDFDGNAEGDTVDNYYGYDADAGESEDPITWETGENAACTPIITSITPTADYYSEYDGKHAGQSCSTGSECSSGTCSAGICIGYGTTSLTINGLYLAPHPEVRFEGSVHWAGEGFNSCFDANNLGSVQTDTSVGDYCIGDDEQTQSQLTLRTPVGAGDTNIQVEVAGERSEESADELDVLSPQIEWISPDDGAIGQYITIHGQNFGSEQGSGYVVMRTADNSRESILSLPESCGDVWDTEEVLAVAPSTYTNADDGSTGNWQTGDEAYIQVVNSSGLFSDPQLFIFSDTTRPNLCSISPQCHENGGQSFTLSGENFDVTQEDGDTVYFSYDNTSGFEANIDSWEDASITGDTSADMGEDTYYVTVYDSETGEQSNARTYEIPCNEGPQVVQIASCNQEEGIYPVPNPRPNKQDSCINAHVGVLFNQEMNESSFTSSTVYLKQYNTVSEGSESTSFDATVTPKDVTGTFDSTDWHVTLNATDEDTSNDIDYYGFQYDVTRTENDAGESSANLQPNTWYELTVTTGVQSSAGLNMSETYTQRFKTDNTTELCEVDSIDTAPSYAILNSYWNGSSVNSQNYTGSAYDADCSLLDPGGYTWDWSIDDITVGHFAFGESRASGDNEQDVYVAGSTTDNEGRAYVNATVNEADDRSEFWVTLGYCETDADCSSCAGSSCNEEARRCTPVITDFSPSNGDHGTWVTINGCYFGSQKGAVYMNGESEAYTQYSPIFDAYAAAVRRRASVEELAPMQAEVDALESVVYSQAEWPNAALCGDTWTNNQIIVEVPDQYDSDRDGNLEVDDLALPAQSYYFQVENFFDDTYEYADEQFTVNSTTRPGICAISPQIAGSGESVDVAGQNLTATKGYATFLTEETDSDENPIRTASSTIDGWADARITRAEVPDDAVTGYSEADYDADGVPDGDDGFIAVLSDATDFQCLDSEDPYCSNPLDFQVSCNSNLDCSTGCCNPSGICLPSSACNSCVTDADCNLLTRCSYIDAEAGITSSCVNGSCTPVIGAISPNSGPNERPVTVQGCYFGAYSAARSAVTFDTDENVVVDILCNNGWTNEQIIIEVPSGIETYNVTTLNEEGREIITEVTTNFDAGTISNVTVTDLNSQISNSMQYNFTAQCTEDAATPESGVPILCYISPSSGRAASADTTEEGREVLYIGEDSRYDYGRLEEDGTYTDGSYQEAVRIGVTYSGQYQEFYAGEGGYISGDGQYVDGSEEYVIEGGGYIDSANQARASVPYGAGSGNARVEYPVVDEDGVTNYCPSNELDFTVSCTNADDCPGGFYCIEGACVESACGCTYPITEDEDGSPNPDECGAPSNGCYYDSGYGGGCCAARPQLLGFSIEDGAENVCLNAYIEVQFDSDVDGTSDAITLYKQTGTTTDDDGDTVPVYEEVTTAVNTYSSEVVDDETFYNVEVSVPSGLDPESIYKLEVTSSEDGASGHIRAADTLLALAGGTQSIEFTSNDTSCRPESIVVTSDSTGETSYTFTAAAETEDITANIYAYNSTGEPQQITETDNITWEISWDYYYDENRCNNVAWITEANETDSPNQVMESGDLNEEQTEMIAYLNWEDTTEGDAGTGALSDQLTVTTHFCDESEELWSYVDQYGGSQYTDHKWPQNFGMFYCYDDEQEDLPALELQYVTPNSTADYFLEYFWQNPSLDLEDEQEAFGIRVYANAENLTPAKWYDENVNNPGSPASFEVDGYEAVKDGHTYYVSVSTVLDDSDSDGVTDSGVLPLYNNIYVISFNEGDRMTPIENEIMESFKFNLNVEAAACEESDKRKLTRDTKRINDIGSIIYYANEYYEEEEEYPVPRSETFGSYITEMTTSTWNSWQGALGNVLGTSLPEDPYNFYYASTSDNPWTVEEDGNTTPWESSDDTFPENEQCLNDPDNNYHFDTAGTCWDEVNQQFYCPENSHVYMYRVDSTNQDDAYLFAHLEYDGTAATNETEDWINQSSMVNPCDDLNTPLTAECSCFNYGLTTGNGYDDDGAPDTGTPGAPGTAEWINY